MESFRFIALTPPGWVEPSLASAACRAGEWGVLDLEFAQDLQTARSSVQSLAREARNPCGIKLDPAGPLTEILMREIPPEFRLAILTESDPDALSQILPILRQKEMTVLLEVHSVVEAETGLRLGVDGFIAKGNEAGGWVGEETAFVLFQSLKTKTSLPVWVQGGIGLHSAAGYIGRAEGVVLSDQLLLTRESPLTEEVRALVARLDGSETVCLGEDIGKRFRAYKTARPGIADRVIRTAADISRSSISPKEKLQAWRREVLGRVGSDSPERSLLPLGQDAAFALSLARRFKTVAGIFQGIRSAGMSHLRAARSLKPFGPESPLAVSHGTRYPIVQGPMTRVSDRSEFAHAVAEAGALPFLALALMRGPEAEALLKETALRLKDRPWGVGILGFVPPELRREQLAVVQKHPPSFALIAGGRPDQALDLERRGIPTYLHVPSPGLLRMFFEEGARRFVFEGRECGGHVGPRSSFVLWDSMVSLLLELLEKETDPSSCHVLFAGGIHDALSAAMAASLAAPLAERGVRIGVLMGTAYLFTREAVASGAILQGFQDEAIRCRTTVLLETGPGHATRCVPTPFAEDFQREKTRLAAEGKTPDEIHDSLENLIVGRLRIASKGITRNPGFEGEPGASKYRTAPEPEQHRDGMYMIGQVAGLKEKNSTMAELHREVSVGSSELLEAARPAPVAEPARPVAGRPVDVAVIGMGSFLPKALDPRTYWENILAKTDAVTEIPQTRWDPRRYFDPDPKARDRVYSRWGGFLEEIPFDPMRYGMPPNSLTSIEPLQLLVLEAVRQALEDAGYEAPSVGLAGRPFDREQASVILGVGGGIGELGQQYAIRAGLPSLVDELPSSVMDRLPEWTEDSFPGILLNVAAGRVANRFDLGGANFIVDAACASSLAAIYLGAQELSAGHCDLVMAGGAETVQNPFAYLCFSKTQALSPRGRCRTFDHEADGIVISEGVAVVVLKRLADAERDGDRIYAVIKGIGASSDGRDKGLTAPRPEGQVRALRRAYRQAGFSPATVGLIEAHGTGTVAGDLAEGESLLQAFSSARALPRSCAIGSVKSMIGHSKCTAGVAGLMKIALALHHKVLPPTLHVQKPNPKLFFPDNPLYVNTEVRPWVSPADHPRRAGVSAFGFGGTNFHAVLEEYTGSVIRRDDPPGRAWPAELFFWTADSKEALAAEIGRLEARLSRPEPPPLRELAAQVWNRTRSAGKGGRIRAGVVASSTDDLREKLSRLRTTWASDPKGIYLAELPTGAAPTLAFLFPGQGSQYPDMLRDLAVAFGEVRERFESADRILAGAFERPLSGYVFPPPRFTSEEESAARAALTDTPVAQAALGAAGMAVFRLLEELGLSPAMAAGHSYGEYSALTAAGSLDEERLYRLSETRGRLIKEAARGKDLGTMAAVSAPAADLTGLIDSIPELSVANHNSPRQTVLSGSAAAIGEAVRRIADAGGAARPIPVACAFHSPFVAPARDLFADFLARVGFDSPRFPVYSNTTGEAHSADPREILSLMSDHLVRPVQFVREIEAMYAAGARIFVESGPKNVLTQLTREILGNRPHLAVAVDMPGRDGRVQLLHALGQLAAAGAEVDLGRLFQGRVASSTGAFEEAGKTAGPPPPTTWMVSGGAVRPMGRPAPSIAEPLRLTPSAQNPAPSGKTQAVGTPDVRPITPPAVSPSASPSTGPREMDGFQTLMRRFLETQEKVMLAFLGRPNGAPPPTAPAAGEADRLSLPSDPPVSIPSPVLRQTAPARNPSLPREVPSENQALSETAVPLPDLFRRIVSERTGYPADMLGEDLHLEADLGIDSIKRVEILGAFQRACPTDLQAGIKAGMERWTAAKTLRALFGEMKKLKPSGAGNGESQPGNPLPETVQAGPSGTGTAPREEDQPELNGRVPRFLMEAEPAPLEGSAVPPLSGRIFLITDDGRGTADELGRRIFQNGGSPVILRSAPASPSDPDHIVIRNFGDPSEIQALINRLRGRGAIAGVFHLLPLGSSEFDPENAAEWSGRLRREIKGLFYLLRAAATDLRGAAGSGPAWVFTASAMGGDFASHEDADHPFFPGHGALAGLMKTLAAEWPEVRSRALDFGPEAPPSDIASRLWDELGAQNSPEEVGYLNGRRIRLRAVPALVGSSVTDALPDPDSVILVTGGARGITAETAIELARRFRPRLVILGRSPLPPGKEAEDTAGEGSPAGIKAALARRAEHAGERPNIPKIEAAYRRLIADREIRKNLDTLARLGARVEYRSADVREGAALENLIRDIYETYGRLDGVIHGAGIIEDQRIEDKTPGSLDRVFDTKAESIFHLARALRPETLRFLVLFSSVAGRFGNPGQADYAAANEVLNKFALYLDRIWPGRVVSANWGPWDRAGMVGPEVRKQFARRGIQVIPPAEGVGLLIDEILNGRKGEVEVVFGDGPWATTEEGRALPAGAGGNPR